MFFKQLLQRLLGRKTKSLSETKSRLTKEEKGVEGERLSAFHSIPIYGYGKQLRNLYLPLPNGETTEVDMVVIHTSGIFVIEVKNYEGWIFGNEKNKYWMQSFSKYNKNQFYNPIWQNDAHIRALKNLLPYECFFSFVVFSEQCELKKIICERPNTYVIRLTGLSHKLRMVMEEYPNVLTGLQVNEIYKKLRPFTLVSEEEKMQHIQYVKSKQACFTKNR